MAQVQAEPGSFELAGHGVQPQGDFGELYGGGVQIHPVDLVESDVGFDFLDLDCAHLRVNLLVKLGFAQGEVEFCKLAHSFNREGTGAHGWLADGQAEHVFGSCDAAFFLQHVNGLADGELCDHLRAVEGGGAFPVAAGLAENEGACWVFAAHLRSAALIHRFGFHDEAVRGNGVGVTGWHYPAAFSGVTLRRDLIEVFLGDETVVGHQPLIDLAKFSHPEGGIGDKAAVFAGRDLG